MSGAQLTKPRSKNENEIGEFYMPNDAPLLILVVENAKAQTELKKLTVGLASLPINYRILIIDNAKVNLGDLKNTYRVSSKEAEKFFTFAQMVLFASSKPSKTLVKAAIERNSVPIISAEVDYLKNYTGPNENGNSFKFQELNSWSMYASIVRALENFGFPYDWKNIIKSAKDVL